MSEIKHTPAPWHVEDRMIVHMPEQKKTAYLAQVFYSKNAVADVRLMALSPELLETVEYIEGRLSEPPLACRTPEARLEELLGWIDEEILPMCRQVIARVKGELETSRQDKCSCCKKPSNDLSLCAENTALLCPACREDAFKLMRAFEGGETE